MSEALAKPSEWRPIESAPLDGTPVLLAVAEGRWVGEARYFEENRGWWEMNTDPTDYFDGQVSCPTHWMPLPEPPTPSDN